MRVLLDTDVVLDVILERPPFFQIAQELFDLHEEGRIEIFLAAITPINVFYLTRKYKGVATARQATSELLSSIKICPLNQTVLMEAQESSFKDFEDAVQHASAAASGLDAVVTRNLKDFKHATLPIFSLPDLLNKLRTEE